MEPQTSDSVSASRRHQRYQRYQAPTVSPCLPDRTWPDRRIERAPRWLSTDLRDGNQALPRPMTALRKLQMFELLTGMGYREIEVGFPAASTDDYNFVRLLIQHDLIPPGVRISVMTPARPELIDRTVASLAGARAATVHLYNATAPYFRQVVLGVGRDECRELAVRGTVHLMKAAESALPGCDLGFEYSPEVFTETEPEFALEVCAAVSDLWQPGPGREIVLNFPATVERTGPPEFADQIEWLHRNLPRREHTCLSVHPHNDRGTAVAAAELAVRAGAQRIEGCLFGHGERAGNVCLVTLGLNLYTQGVDPGIDFSDLDGARRVVEACTSLPVHQRHPYAGDLVYTAFSGAHQDALKKGFAALRRKAAASGVPVSALRWDMPYLPIDPADVGREYQPLVRITSQSGKGGVGYVIAAEYGLDLPGGLQAEFAVLVQACSEASGAEITASQLWRVFSREYRLSRPAAALCRQLGVLRAAPLIARLATRGPAAGAAERHCHPLADRGRVACYVRCAGTNPAWGVGIARTARLASLRAMLSAAGRARASQTPSLASQAPRSPQSPRSPRSSPESEPAGEQRAAATRLRRSPSRRDGRDRAAAAAGSRPC